MKTLNEWNKAIEKAGELRCPLFLDETPLVELLLSEINEHIIHNDLCHQDFTSLNAYAAAMVLFPEKRGDGYHDWAHLYLTPHGVGVLLDRPANSVQQSCASGKFYHAIQDAAGRWRIPVETIYRNFSLPEYISERLERAEKVVNELYDHF